MDSRDRAYISRPPYPQINAANASASTPQSVFQSSSSLESVSSTSSSQLPGTYLSSSSAPLPSPSVSQPNNSYFSSTMSGSLSGQEASRVTQRSNQTQQQQQQQQQHPQQAQAQQSQYAYIGQRGGGQGMPETAPYLNDFSLLSEAANRAQMACLERDLGEVGL